MNARIAQQKALVIRAFIGRPGGTCAHARVLAGLERAKRLPLLK
jgi:hypothetical protein